MRTRTTPRTVRLLSTVVAAGVAGTLAWTPTAQAADAKPLDFGPGYTIPDSDGNAATSHIGAYGPPGIKVWGDSETYCADPERKGPQAAGGYTGPKSVTHWTSSETGQAVPDSHVAYASYVIGKYGQTQSDEQAAAVDAATYEFLAGGKYAINGSRGKQRLGYPNVSPTARTLAEGYIAEARKYAGPYTLHIKPSVETTTAGKKVSVAVEVTASRSGAKVPGVTIDLSETGSGTARGSVITGKDGTASWQFTAATAGDATVKATASGLPGSQLKVLEPRDASAQRMLLAGDTTDAEGTTKVKVTPATGGVVIHKTDPGKNTMAGAGFQLIDPATGKTVAEGKTNADGILAFENLAPGTYRLHETDSGDKIHALVPDQDIVITEGQSAKAHSITVPSRPGTPWSSPPVARLAAPARRRAPPRFQEPPLSPSVRENPFQEYLVSPRHLADSTAIGDPGLQPLRDLGWAPHHDDLGIMWNQVCQGSLLFALADLPDGSMTRVV